MSLLHVYLSVLVNSQNQAIVMKADLSLYFVVFALFCSRFCTILISPDSESFDKLEAIVCNGTLMKDVELISSDGQTSHLEAFHSLVIQYCPKSHVFGNLGMKVR